MRSLFVSLLTVPFLGGCKLSTDSREILRVDISISPATVRGGDTAVVAVRLVNPTLAATTVAGSSTCRLAFDVLDKNGLRVGGSPDRGMCTTDLLSVVLAGGQSDAQVFRWAAVQASGQPVPPGSYTIVGRSLWVNGLQSAPRAFSILTR